jgi:hypothetical protein
MGVGWSAPRPGGFTSGKRSVAFVQEARRAPGKFSGVSLRKIGIFIEIKLLMLYMNVNSSDVGATQYCKGRTVYLSISFQYQDECG